VSQVGVDETLSGLDALGRLPKSHDPFVVVPPDAQMKSDGFLRLVDPVVLFTVVEKQNRLQSWSSWHSVPPFSLIIRINRYPTRLPGVGQLRKRGAKKLRIRLIAFIGSR
jgi:hypothetical protein